MFVHGSSQSSSKSIKFASKNDLKVGAFLGVHMLNSSSTGKRPTFYSKMVPEIDPKIIKVGGIFSLLFSPPI